MTSVRLNNAISENYTAGPDAMSQWSHAGCVPLYVAAMNLAGIRPIEPGYRRYEIRPQLADLPDLELTVQTPHGPIAFSERGPMGLRTLQLTLPPGAEGEIWVNASEQLALPSTGKGRYRLPAGQSVTLELKFT
jgi:alpha-L-rhamnosidase